MRIDFSHLNILVIGESCTDEYIHTKTNGTSPEFNVPKVVVEKIERTEGMAANVYKNILSLNASASLFTQKMDKPKTVKSRLIVDGEHVYRIDRDFHNAPSEQQLKQLTRLLANKQFDGIIVTDYGKGFITSELMKIVTDSKLPVLVDPYRDSPLYLYSGATFICPNRTELIGLTGTDDLFDAYELIKDTTKCTNVLNKLSEDGVFWISEDLTFDYPALSKNPVDVSGCGDTMASSFFLSYLSGHSVQKSLQIASFAAKVVVEKEGTQVCTLQELMDEAFGDNKVL